MKTKLLALSLLTLSSSVFAVPTPITIQNANFDTQVLSDGAFTHSVQGWAVIDGYAGIYNPPESVITGEAGDGFHTNTLYLIGESTVTQTLATNLASNTDYTLSFDVGDRLDTNFPNYIVKVRAAGNTIFTAINPLIPNGGSFSNVTLDFSTGDNAYAGSSMVIELVATGDGQVSFDNFTLSSEAGSGTSSSRFGDWNHPDLGGIVHAKDTPYLAETDGFITFFNSGSCNGHTYAIRVGDSSSTATNFLSRVDGYGGMSAPVKGGQYWQIDQTVYGSGTCTLRIGFLPLLP